MVELWSEALRLQVQTALMDLAWDFLLNSYTHSCLRCMSEYLGFSCEPLSLSQGHGLAQLVELLPEALSGTFFPFLTVSHDWYIKFCGMYIVHMKDPLQSVVKNS